MIPPQTFNTLVVEQPNLELIEPDANELFGDVAQYAAKSHRDRMGFQAAPTKEDFAIVRAENMRICSHLSYVCSLPTNRYCPIVNRDKAPLLQILSKAAIEIISQTPYDKRREGATEPPYMAPSIDPEDYPQVRMFPTPQACSSRFASGAVCVTTSVALWYCVLAAE